MKVLILTVTAGEGHNSISNAVCEYLIKNNAEAKIYDLYKGKDAFRAKVSNDGYFLICKRFRPFANMWYDRMKKHDYTIKKYQGLSFMVKRAQHEVEQLIQDYSPDVVVCTHLFCAIIMSTIKSRQEVAYKSMYIVTDYDIYPFIETTKNVDYLILPSQDLAQDAINKGYDKSQILTFGIPVKHKFTLNYNKQEMREKYSLDPSKFTVMIMSGGVGSSNSLKIIKSMKFLKDTVQIVCVCGRNDRLKSRIDRLVCDSSYPKIVNFGYTNDIHMLMAASDCIITKGGAATICECLSMNLPIILNTKLSWQERCNKEFLEKNHAVIHMKNQKNAGKYIGYLVENPSVIESIKDNIMQIKKPNAASELGDFILNIK